MSGEAQIDAAVRERMRADWNERAREDAHYYVAFGRREQDDEEFFSTAADVVRDLERELQRFLPGTASANRRALEIGCGPGRLLRPMSRHFHEIHGIDVSDEMIARAREKLRGIPHAHAHHASGSDLALFPDEYFDFVYSYAVFQHIPSAEVVFSYLRETVRVLKPGGFARLQINGLPKTAKEYTTWSGVRVSEAEVKEFTKRHGMRLLSLTGIETQYMWATWQKPPAAIIRSVSNAFSGEQAVPASGRMACATLWIENLPDECDLNRLTAVVDGRQAEGCYIGPPAKGLSQFNVPLPKNVRTGMVPVHIELDGKRISKPTTIRVIPAGPSVPRLAVLSDGVNLMSGPRVESGSIKITLEEVDAIEKFSATVDDVPVRGIETFCTDPLPSRYEVNFQMPEGIDAGGHVLEVRLGSRLLARLGIEVCAR